MKHKTLWITSAITVVLMTLSVATYVWMRDLHEARSSFGPVVVLLLVIIAIPTVACLMITLGIWMFQRNRSENELTDILGQKSDKMKGLE
jgi:hypothetical protein